MANIERLKEIKDLIINNPNKLYMSYWDINYDEDMRKEKVYGKCDTAKCIAGWAVYLYDRENYPGIDDDLTLFEELAIKQLELTESEANRLFYCKDDEAIDCLDELIYSEWRE